MQVIITMSQEEYDLHMKSIDILEKTKERMLRSDTTINNVDHYNEINNHLKQLTAQKAQ